MKARILNYTFDASAKTITLTDYVTVKQEGILLITNTLTGTIIYNFADPAKGGTVLGNVLTLEYNTTTMADTDPIQIYYDDGSSIVSDIDVMQSDIAIMKDLLKSLPIIYGESYISPLDFSVVYTSLTTLTTSGANGFIIDDSVCYVAMVVVKNAAGAWTKYTNAHNGVSLTASSGVITIAGVTGTPFINTDTAYRVVVLYQHRSYDPTTDTEKITVQNPLNASYVQDSLVDTTNITAGTIYYPSATGMSMDGFKDLSITGKLIEGDAVLDTIAVEVTNDEDTATLDWITTYWFNPNTNSMQNLITTASVAGTYTFLMDFDNFNFSYFRVKVVLADSTNTLIIKSRRKAL